MRKHVMISGTGRAGTSFLMQLLTNLHLETGYTPETMRLDENSRAGLEWDIRKDNAPYIIKSPWFCERAEEIVQRDDIVLEHVFIPMRDIRAAAESRRFVVGNALKKMSLWGRLKGRFKPPKVKGGLVKTKRQDNQEKVLLEELHKLLLALSSVHVPVTLLQYPKLVRDSRYLFEKLQPILGSISYERFETAFRQTVRPDWVHNFGASETP